MDLSQFNISGTFINQSHWIFNDLRQKLDPLTVNLVSLKTLHGLIDEALIEFKELISEGYQIEVEHYSSLFVNRFHFYVFLHDVPDENIPLLNL